MAIPAMGVLAGGEKEVEHEEGEGYLGVVTVGSEVAKGGLSTGPVHGGGRRRRAVAGLPMEDERGQAGKLQCDEGNPFRGLGCVEKGRRWWRGVGKLGSGKLVARMEVLAARGGGVKGGEHAQGTGGGRSWPERRRLGMGVERQPWLYCARSRSSWRRKEGGSV